LKLEMCWCIAVSFYIIFSTANGQFYHIIQITNSSVYISNDVTRVGRSDQNDTLSSESNDKSQTGVNAGPVKGGAALLAKGGAAPPVPALAPLAKAAAALPAKAAAAAPVKAATAASAKGAAAPPAAAPPAKRARREVKNPKILAFEFLFNPNKAELMAPAEQV
jgi:hypothetical protein